MELKIITEATPLSSFGCGACVQLHSLCVDPEQAERLREMGLCEGRCFSVLHNSDKMIVRSGGCRIGLHRDLALQILGQEV